MPTDQRHPKGIFEALSGFLSAEFGTFHTVAVDGGRYPIWGAVGTRVQLRDTLVVLRRQATPDSGCSRKDR